MSSLLTDHIVAVISQIPSGFVTSYSTVGQIVSGVYHSAVSGWIVGRILTSMNYQSTLCPRRRVINTKGYISSLKLGTKGIVQIQLLRQEGIQVVDGYVDMDRYGRQVCDRS